MTEDQPKRPFFAADPRWWEGHRKWLMVIGREWPREAVLMDLAYHQDQQYRRLKRGLAVRWPSQGKLAREWKWGRGKVRTLFQEGHRQEWWDGFKPVPLNPPKKPAGASKPQPEANPEADQEQPEADPSASNSDPSATQTDGATLYGSIISELASTRNPPMDNPLECNGDPSAAQTKPVDDPRSPPHGTHTHTGTPTPTDAPAPAKAGRGEGERSALSLNTRSQQPAAESSGDGGSDEQGKRGHPGTVGRRRGAKRGADAGRGRWPRGNAGP